MSHRTRPTVEIAELTSAQRDALSEVLKTRRDEIFRHEAESSSDGQAAERMRTADENDLASAVWDRTVGQRMRGREAKLLKKINKALRLLDEGEYGECEECGGYIGYNRLSARPEATLCVECKERQEQVERGFHKVRRVDNDFSFK